jgi:hypothetical protein
LTGIISLAKSDIDPYIYVNAAHGAGMIFLHKATAPPSKFLLADTGYMRLITGEL